MYQNPASMTAEQRHAIRASKTRADFGMDYGPAAVYVREEAGRIVAAGFIGKAVKAAWCYAFKTMQAAGAYADEWAANVAASKAAVAKRRAESAAFRHTLQVGDVLVCSWGYDQTNVDWYEVTARIGSTMVEVRKIAAESVQDGDMSGRCTPVRGKFTAAPFKARVQHGNSIRITSYATATPADFVEIAGARVYRPMRWTAYA